MFLEFSPETRLILSVIVAFLLSSLLRSPVYKVCKKKGCFEHANGRSSHTGEIPNIGGAIIFISFLTTAFLFVKFSIPEIQYILLASSMAFVLGLYDDLLIISFKKKFIGEIIGAIFLILGGVYFTNFHGLFGLNEISLWLGIPFTLFMIVGVVNSLNLIDGIDGLCSGLSALIITAFSIWFFKNGFTSYAIIGGSISAAIIPFFIINVFSVNRKMFLGDNGSLFLGMVLSSIVIKFSELSVGVNDWSDFSNAPAVAFCFLTIPVLDTIMVFIVRMINGNSPFSPDKRHFHHKLLYLFNNNHKKATFTILAIQLLFIIIGISGSQMSNEFLITLSTIVFLIIYFVILKLYINKEKLNLLK